MHELSLYGSVPAERHDRLIQQLAGVTCMQPQDVKQIHLVFRARTPAGLEKVQGNRDSQGVQQQQDVQKLRTMLQSGIYHVQLVGSIEGGNANVDRQDAENINSRHDKSGQGKVSWTLEFKDTPEAGKQSTITRLVSRTKFEHGEMIPFLDLFGFEYISRYFVEGQKFYDQDTILFLHRVHELPSAQDAISASDITKLPPATELNLLDPTGAYLLHATVDIADGNSQELRNRATGYLEAMRNNLDSAVKLRVPDRLSLDTRIAIPMRRV